MPIYVFECTTCGERFERLQKLSDPDPDACPECGAPSVRRRLTAPAFRLSGSGWYETDFKKDGDKKRNLVETGEQKHADAVPADAKPAEAKPAAGTKPSEGAKASDGKAAEKTPAAKAESKPATPAAGS